MTSRDLGIEEPTTSIEDQELGRLLELSRIVQSFVSKSGSSLSLPLEPFLEIFIDLCMCLSRFFDPRDTQTRIFRGTDNASPSWNEGTPTNPVLKSGEMPFGIPELSFQKATVVKVPQSEEALQFFEDLACWGVQLKRVIGSAPKNLSRVFKEAWTDFWFDGGSGEKLAQYLGRVESDIWDLKSAAQVITQQKNRLDGARRKRNIARDLLQSRQRKLGLDVNYIRPKPRRSGKKQ